MWENVQISLRYMKKYIYISVYLFSLRCDLPFILDIVIPHFDLVSLLAETDIQLLPT